MGPVCASLVVHAALLYSIDLIKLQPRGQVTDVMEESAETSLMLAPALAPEAPRRVVALPAPPPPRPPVVHVKEPKVAEAVNKDALTLWNASTPPKAEATPLTTPPQVAETAALPEPESADPLPEPPPTAASASVSFAGVKAERAGRIVYALDASGAMTTSLAYVKTELARSISRLEEGQRFQIVVFRQLPGGVKPVIEMFDSSGSFAAATDEAKTRAAVWLAGIEPAGSSQPLAGLRSALVFKPDLIYLLTRSIRRSGQNSAWGQGTRATLDELDRLNPKGRGGARGTVIKALQFIDNDPTGMLQEIGNTHGDGPGSYRVIAGPNGK